MREGRSSWRRIGLYMSAITLGVGALVAINSFRGNIVQAIQRESRTLLGADLEIHSRPPFPAPVQLVLDSVAESGAPMSYVTSLPSMARSPRTELSRLVQVRALEGLFPYYGEITTDPVEAWGRLQDETVAVVDVGVTIQLDIDIGDSLQLGEATFEIAGIITSSPGEVSFQSAIGPRVYIPARHLEATGLVQFGSLVRYQAYLKIEDSPTLQAFINRHNQFFRDHNVGYDTVAERVEDLTEAMSNMTRFLGLVGLTALLLGGVGVASAISVFIKDKLETVAVLRCLGATQATVFAAYLFQAIALGLAGATAGVLLGLGVQSTLPRVLGDFLPLDVSMSVDWLSVIVGLTIGVWVSGMFALLPLITVRDIPPLRALRRDVEHVSPPPPIAQVAYLCLGGVDGQYRGDQRVAGANARHGRRVHGSDNAHRGPPVDHCAAPHADHPKAFSQTRPLCRASGSGQPVPTSEPDGRGDRRARLRRVHHRHDLPRAAQSARAVQDRSDH